MSGHRVAPGPLRCVGHTGVRTGDAQTGSPNETRSPERGRGTVEVRGLRARSRVGRAVKLVITPHRPVRKALIAVGLTLAVLLAVVVALDYGHWRAIAGAMVSTGEKRSLLDEAVTLRRENERLRFQLARLRRTEEIHRSAREENHDLLVEGAEAFVDAVLAKAPERS